MKPMPKLLLSTAAAVLLSLASLPASAQQYSVSPDQKTEIEKIVHDYLIQHPEVIKEAIEALQAKEEAGKADSQAKTVAAHKGELLSDPATPVAGNPVGDVTIVEFFDYHCPYCKAVAGPLEQLLKDDKGVRLVLKEFPILGDDSVLASRAALASVAQGKYWAFHQALMEHRGSFDAETVRALAAGVGIDTKKLQADMADAKTSPLIEANHKLAEVLDVGATPTWVIGGKIVEGAVPLEQLKELIKQARGS
jgi:protein-disulfide isomerase